MAGRLSPFSAFFKNVDAEADAIIAQGADDVARIAEFEVISAAYDTGRLSEGFAVQRIRALAYRISNNVYYASYVHDGTIHMNARPFMDWAVDAHGDTTVRRLEGLLNGRRGISGGSSKMSVEEASKLLGG